MVWTLCNVLHWQPKHGYVNLIMNEYAYYGKGHTIHSAGQIEWHKNLVDDKSVRVGGKQCITTLLCISLEVYRRTHVPEYHVQAHR